MSSVQKKKLKNASANALKLCLRKSTLFDTHTDIHAMAKRSPPDNYCKYKHAITMYKLFNICIPSQEHFYLNFQLADNERDDCFVFVKSQNYKVGDNILLNRFTVLNKMIKKEWINLSFDAYKVKCKTLFLTVD